MNFAVISSGSKGNSYAFWNESDGILVDCGLSYVKLRDRFEQLELDPWQFQHVLISHYHGDHVSAVRKWHSKHGGELYSHPLTIAEVPWLDQNSFLINEIEFRRPFQCGSFIVNPWPVLHDTPGAVTFSLRDNDHKVGMILETGRITAEIMADCADADAVIVEANHEPDLVTASVNTGQIPIQTGQRILATHLRNQTAAKYVAQHKRVKVAVFAHLSEDRNSPELARKAFAEAMADEFRSPDEVHLIVAEQYAPSEVINLDTFVQPLQRVAVDHQAEKEIANVGTAAT